jgi:hypothetical protein
MRVAKLWSGLCLGLFTLALCQALFNTSPLAFGWLRWQNSLLVAIAAAITALFLPSSLLSLPSFLFLPLLLPALALLAPTVNPLRDWVLLLGAYGGTVAIVLHNRPQDHPTTGDGLRRRLLYPLTLALITAIIYLRTLAPTVGEADTFEFQVNVIRLGISHGSGYPLYILLAKLFSLLPIPGTAAFRINLSSAAFGVAAALMVYAAARTLTASRPAAWIAALSLAASIGLWSRAVEAEVYTLHVALVGSILLVTLRSLETGDWRLEIGGWRLEIGSWDFLFFLFGLSLTNHLTTVLLAPAIGLSLMANRKSLTGKLHLSGRFGILRFGIWVLLFLLGLSLYLYLPLRWPAVNNGETMTWEMFRHFITGAEAQGALRLDAWYADFSRYAILGRKVLDQFGWLGIITALVGLIALFRQKPLAAFVTLAAWAAYAFFGLSFYVPDPDYSSFLLPAHFVQAVWIAVGIAHIAQFTIRNSQFAIRNWELSIVHCAFFLLPASLLWTNLPLVDQSADWRKYHLGQYILNQPLKQGAAILADSELIAPLYYLQIAEGIRPDLDIIVLPNEEAYRAELEARLANGQTVYLGRYLPHLANAYYLHAVGPLTEVKTGPSPLPDDLTPVEKDFGASIRLRGFKLASLTIPADDSLLITLYWQALQPPPGNDRVLFRLLDSNGETRFTSPANIPVGQMYPTAAWPLDDVVADFHRIALDPALEPGAYALQVGLFPPFAAGGLSAPDGSSWLTLTILHLQPPNAEPIINHPLRVQFSNGVWLMGSDGPKTIAPKSKVEMTLYWLSPSGADGAAAVCLDEACSAPIQVRLNASSRPVGRIFETHLTFTAPVSGGRLTPSIQLEGQSATCGWFSGMAPRCPLPPIAIVGEPVARDVVNFDNQIALESLSLETPVAWPGGTVVVTARWRGLSPMRDDYTVFIHLLGPDGQVHGQVDMWPVSGTRPTSGWPVGDPITDRFEVRVPDDAPKGAYQIEAGWYLLATLDRLSVLDSEGVAIDDSYLLPGLTIQ